MKSISGKKLCKILERQGWVLKRVKGSHHIYAKQGEQSILSVPVHGSRDIPLGTLRGLMKDAGLTESDLE